MLLKTVSFSLCFWFSLIFFPDNDKQAHLSLSTEHPIINTNVHPLHFHLKLDSVPALLVLIQLCDCRCNWCQGLLKNLPAVVSLITWTTASFLPSCKFTPMAIGSALLGTAVSFAVLTKPWQSWIKCYPGKLLLVVLL